MAYRYRGILGSAITVPALLPYSRYHNHGITAKCPPFPLNPITALTAVGLLLCFPLPCHSLLVTLIFDLLTWMVSPGVFIASYSSYE